MAAAQSGEIFCVGECLNNNFNPFLENSLHETARDFARNFPNVYGHKLRDVIDNAIKQWREQIPDAQLNQMITKPQTFYPEFTVVPKP